MQQRHKNFFQRTSPFVRSGLMLLVLILHLEVKSQVHYYFVYESAVKGEAHIFRALVSLEPDGTAMARVQYNQGAQNKLYLYELSLVDSNIQQGTASIKYLVPHAEAVPLLESDSAGFMKPRFFFKKFRDSVGGYFYTAIGSEIEVEPNSWKPAALTINQERTYQELRKDEPFVSSFYFDTEPFYSYIFDESNRVNPVARTEKVFLLIVANTNDSTVGESANTDLKNVNRLFTNLSRDLGISHIYPLIISGNDYSKQAVEAALAVLEKQKPSEKDIVVFYFSGHGFRLATDKSNYPRMSFRTAQNKARKQVGDNIPLEDVYNRIKALKPGVTFVLGDCCNADIYQNPVVGGDLIRPKGGGALGNFNYENGKKLFLPPSPVSIIVGSVKKNYLSLGNPDIGGYYTHYFLSELEKNLWGYYGASRISVAGVSNASWLRMLKAAREAAYWKAKRKQCGKTANDRCIQEAEMEVIPPQ